MPSDESEIVPSRSRSTCDRLVARAARATWAETVTRKSALRPLVRSKGGSFRRSPDGGCCRNRPTRSADCVSRSRSTDRVQPIAFNCRFRSVSGCTPGGAPRRPRRPSRRARCAEAASSWPCVASAAASPLVGSASTSSMAVDELVDLRAELLDLGVAAFCVARCLGVGRFLARLRRPMLRCRPNRRRRRSCRRRPAGRGAGPRWRPFGGAWCAETWSWCWFLLGCSRVHAGVHGYCKCRCTRSGTCTILFEDGAVGLSNPYSLRVLQRR